VDGRALELLIDLLVANNVIIDQDGRITLSSEFEMALQYRDLLEAKVALAIYVASDFTNFFPALIGNPNVFCQKARIFNLFSYNKGMEYSPENYELTKRWMRITTALTKYEARVCIKYHDFSPYGRMLDVGGNSGEFGLQICKEHQGVAATVFDLPVVCHVGEQHVREEPERDRICFIKGNALEDALPKGFDLITFKSMLHDWPETETRRLITKARDSLEAGGTILIFERGPFEQTRNLPAFSLVPFLLFFRSFRPPTFYEDTLNSLGFHNITVEKLFLEMPFYLITARKGT
jgi:ubiquinone/menaquinone biosynthesis C-methylase UbiE